MPIAGRFGRDVDPGEPSQAPLRKRPDGCRRGSEPGRRRGTACRCRPWPAARGAPPGRPRRRMNCRWHRCCRSSRPGVVAGRGQASHAFRGRTWNLGARPAIPPGATRSPSRAPPGATITAIASRACGRGWTMGAPSPAAPRGSQVQKGAAPGARRRSRWPGMSGGGLTAPSAGRDGPGEAPEALQDAMPNEP